MALHLVLEKSLGDLNEDQEEMLQTARSDLDRLKRMLEHLLQIARIEHTETLSRSRISVVAILERTLEARTMSADEKSIQLSIDVDKELPPVFADKDVLEVAVSNLLSNAIKYSPNGSVATLYAKPIDRKFRLGVLDEGPGLSEEDSRRVFDKFYRSPDMRRSGGVGLGLSLVKEIALAHNGTVGQCNRTTKGSNFWLEIPTV